MVSSKIYSTSRNDHDIITKRAPDGGWGWVVVAGSMFLNFLIGGAVNTFGVIYVTLLDKFQQSAGVTAWVGSLANAMGLLLGPLSSALSARFSCRTMVIIGGILTSLGWISTGFMPRLEYMFISYGILAGIGKSLAFTPSILIVGQWFDRRRSLANGLSVAGAGFGTFAFAPLLETLLNKYGFTYTMLIMGAVMLVMSLCGILFRPVPTDTVKIDPVSKIICRSESTENDYVNKTSTLEESHQNCDDKNENTENVNDRLPINKTLKDYLDYTVLKKFKFLCFVFSIMLATLGHSPASVMLPPLAIQNDVEPGKAAFLLSITGVTDIIGRLLFGAICDATALRNKRKYLYVASMFISGMANITCGFATDYWHFIMYSVIFGLFAGSYNALTPVILVDLLGVDKLPSSFGLALLFQGIGFLLGPPIAGWMRDGFGNYQSAFFFAGIAMTAGSFVINISSLCHIHEALQTVVRRHSDPTRQETSSRDDEKSMQRNVDCPNSVISVIPGPNDLNPVYKISNIGAHLNLAYTKEIDCDRENETKFINIRF